LCLQARLSKYFSLNHLKKSLLKSNSNIHKSILKYVYSNFTLVILENYKPILLIAREQYYIDILNPEYNICKIAGSSLGRKHAEETKEAISLALKGRKLSSEAKAKLKGRKHSIETIIKLKNYKPSDENRFKLILGGAKARQSLL